MLNWSQTQIKIDIIELLIILADLALRRFVNDELIWPYNHDLSFFVSSCNVKLRHEMIESQ